MRLGLVLCHSGLTGGTCPAHREAADLDKPLSYHTGRDCEKSDGTLRLAESRSVAVGTPSIDGNQREGCRWLVSAIVKPRDWFRRLGEGVFSCKQRGDPGLHARHERGEAVGFGQTRSNPIRRVGEGLFSF